MFLVDSVVSQLWDVLPATTPEKGHFLDSACGSGAFLVRSFQRLGKNWRTTRQARTISARVLRGLDHIPCIGQANTVSPP
jgi:type I restriction-modification system DNA methylase subunit